MNENIAMNPTFELVTDKTDTYKYFEDYFLSLEKLFWVTEEFRRRLQQKQFRFEDTSRHQRLLFHHLTWLEGQVHGILILLSKVLNSQAKQLIRSLWEAKVNLLYIARNPEARSKTFDDLMDKEFEKIRKEAERPEKEVNYISLIPPELKNLPKLPDFDIPSEIWKEHIFDRAAEIGLQNEYRSIYKAFSWDSHVSIGALAHYMKSDAKSITYTPNQDPEDVPLHLTLASDITAEILKEVNNPLKVFSDSEIKSIEQDIVSLWEKLNKDYTANEGFSELVEKYRSAKLAAQDSNKN